MDERDADIFVDQAAMSAARTEHSSSQSLLGRVIGDGIRDDGGLAEERQENWGAVEGGERGNRSGLPATTVVCFRGWYAGDGSGSPCLRRPSPGNPGQRLPTGIPRSPVKRAWRATLSSSRQDKIGGVLRSPRNKQVVVMVDHFLT